MTVLEDRGLEDSALADGRTATGRCRPPHDERWSLRSVLDLPALDPEVVAVCRDRSRGLSDRITARIRDEVAAFSTTTDPRIESAITEAIHRAVDTFMDALGERPTDVRVVFGFYRRLGLLQGLAGHDLDAMQAAHQIATQECWDELREMTLALGLPAEVVARAGHAVMTYQRHLLESATSGLRASRGEGPSAAREARGRLLVALLGGHVDQLCSLADAAAWPVPTTASVVAAHVGHDVDLTALVTDHPFALTAARRGVLTVVVDTEHADAVARAVRCATARPVAVTWAVDAADVVHAARWARRTLGLVAEELIDVPADGVVRCRDHQARLALHADPTLRRHADRDVLAPLMSEGPKRRCALAETLLAWLRTRPSAPALAAQLGVHEQTVRHRIRRLRALFGDDLDDPTSATGLLTALESVTPRWRREAA